MKVCAFCGNNVKDTCTVCPKCKTPITPPDEAIFPTLRQSRHKKTAAETEAERIAREQAEAERAAQAALAPDDPAAELHASDEGRREKIREHKLFAATAYTGLLFFVPLRACKNKEYATFHANQGLVILLLLAVGVVAVNMLGDSPVMYSICMGFFGGLFYLMVLGMIRVFCGSMEPLPIIGGIKLLRYNGKK
ncbi:MAG: hypothetical protein Q4E65_02820 [Clostridia bacterium]|nr:hypothetical protein [Clostridia bacterium]